LSLFKISLNFHRQTEPEQLWFTPVVPPACCVSTNRISAWEQAHRPAPQTQLPAENPLDQLILCKKGRQHLKQVVGILTTRQFSNGVHGKLRHADI